MSGDALVVQCLGQNQHAALGVQLEEAAALWVQAAVQREHQLAVGISVLCTNLQDVLPRRCVLGDPHLKTRGVRSSKSGSGHFRYEVFFSFELHIRN